MYKNFKMRFNYRYVENDDAVICFAEPTIEDESLKRYIAIYIGLKGEEPRATIAPEYKGVARFKAGDTFDIDIAREIARDKAVRSAFKAFRNLMNEIADTIYDEYIDSIGFIESISKKIEDVQADINELTAKD